MRDVSKAGSGPWVRESVIDTVILMVNGIIAITSPVYRWGNFTALSSQQGVVSGPKSNIRPWKIWFNGQKVVWQTEWAMESYLEKDELFRTKPMNTLRMSEANLEVGYLWENNTWWELCYLWASQVVQWYDSACQCRRNGFNPWVRKIPCSRKWQPTPVFLLEIPWTEEADGLHSMRL